MVGPDKDIQKEECAKAQPLTRFADKRCVLVIHEDEKMCGMLTACLSEHFTVKTVIQPACALKDVREIIFDVILCNFIMPEISGLDIAQAAKQAQPQTPVIILSNTEWNEKSLRNAMRNGVADIVKTPIENMEALLTKILVTLKK